MRTYRSEVLTKYGLDDEEEEKEEEATHQTLPVGAHLLAKVAYGPCASFARKWSLIGKMNLGRVTVLVAESPANELHRTLP